ncbi:MAG: response regulator [Planctomycetaceae bacterium]
MFVPKHRFRLLIADDDRGVRETLVDMLQPDFGTITVESGEEALEVVEHEEVHLLLLDVHMPILTGLDALRVVRHRRAELPCILMSADWTAPLRLEAIESQATAVLDKPMTRRQLVATITIALEETYSDLWTPDSESP